MATVIQSTMAGAPEGERNRDWSLLPPALLATTSLASLNEFFTVSSPRLATKAGCGGGVEEERGGGEVWEGGDEGV